MNWWDTLGGWGSAAWRAVLGLGGAIGGALAAQWRFTNSIISGAFYQILHPINTVESNVAIFAGLVTGNLTAVHNAIDRLEGWQQARVVKPMRSWVRGQIAKLWRVIVANRKMLWARITLVNASIRAWVLRLIRLERRARERGDAWLRALIMRLIHLERVARRRADARLHAFIIQRVKWALQIVDGEAASGYRTGYSGQVNTAVSVLENIATRNPIVKGLIGLLVNGVLDLASVENPIARFTAGFLLKHVISKLGVEKPLGDLAASILGPLLGQPHPRNLHDVVMAITNRIGALEQDWATFMADGGPQIEQAGQQWRDLTSIGLDAALVAFAVAGVADPGGTARELSAVIRPIGTTTIADVANLLAGR